MKDKSYKPTTKKAKEINAKFKYNVGVSWIKLALPISIGVKLSAFTSSWVGCAIIGLTILILGNRMRNVGLKELDQLSKK